LPPSVKSHLLAASGVGAVLPAGMTRRNWYSCVSSISEPLSYEPAGSRLTTLSVVPILMAPPAGVAPEEEGAPPATGAELTGAAPDPVATAPDPVATAPDPVATALDPVATAAELAVAPEDGATGALATGVLAGEDEDEDEEGDEEEEALSVRPEPQAATDAARVRTPAAAMTRRDVVLRMEPLSVEPAGPTTKRTGSGGCSARCRFCPATCNLPTLRSGPTVGVHARSRLGNNLTGLARVSPEDQR